MRALLILAIVLALPVSAHAQERSQGGWSTLRIAKWATLGVSAGAAVYGYQQNQRADQRYDALELACLAQPTVCLQRTGAGRYQSAELEDRYQDVLRLDRRARTALLASQVGIVASITMFIIDLRNADAPEDILYEPKPLQLTPSRDGGVQLRLTFSH